MPDTDNFVYINAPTLDNADECKFIRNNDFLYATAGEEDRGTSANLVLYEKLIDTDWHNPYDASDLARTYFVDGRWAVSGMEASARGDYHIGNLVKISLKYFNIGKLNAFKFNFFDRDTLTETTAPTVITDLTSNKSVDRIALFLPVISAQNTVSGFKFAGYGLVDTEHPPTADDTMHTFLMDRAAYITPEMFNADRAGLCIVYMPKTFTGTWNINENTVYQFQSGNSLRSLSLNPGTKMVCMRSVPRGALETASYIVGDVDNTTSGLTSGQNRLIEFLYNMEVDLVNEYLTDNSHNHHMDMYDIQNINQLRYTAPFINRESVYEAKIAAVNEFYITDNSITRNGAIDCLNKPIHSVSIPLRYSDDAVDYRQGITTKNLFHSLHESPNRLCHTSRQMDISIGERDADNNLIWYKSENIISYSYFEESMVYTFTFPEKIKYTGNGLWIKGSRVSGEQGVNNLGIRVYKHEDNYYSFDSEDYAIFSEAAGTTVKPCTCDVRISFDYSLRHDWFDYVETLQRQNDTLGDEIDNINFDITKLEQRVENVYNSLYEDNTTVINNYINESNIDRTERLTISWIQIGGCHTTQLDGILDTFTLYISSKGNDSDYNIYTTPVYLCVMEEGDDGTFVHKATSINAVTLTKGGYGTWKFQDTVLSKKPIRLGLVTTRTEVLKDLGVAQTNKNFITAILNNPGGNHDDCFCCTPNGQKDGGQPYQNVPEVPWAANIYRNKASNFAEDFSQHINNLDIHVTLEDKERWNKAAEDIYNITYSYVDIHEGTPTEEGLIKWVQYGGEHVAEIAGEVKSVEITMAENTWVPEGYYANPVYLCIMEDDGNGTYVKKAVSTNAVTPQQGFTHEWLFEDLELSGRGIRLGYVWNPADSLIGDAPTAEQLAAAPTMGVKLIRKASMIACSCYIKKEDGTSDINYTVPMRFKVPAELAGDKELQEIRNEINNITNNYFPGENTLKLGKWRIYVNDEGSLVIDTETLFNAGKSIVFKDLE